MTVFVDKEIACPWCGVRSRRSVVTSLAGARRRDLRQAIIDETFQRFTCEVCARAYVAEEPFVYIDFERKHWVGVFPSVWERDWQRLEDEPAGAFRRNMLENSPPLVKTMAVGFVVRAVFGLSALREKLVAWDAGIDDRALETLKLDLMRSTQGLLFDERARLRLRAAGEATLAFTGTVPDEAGEWTGVTLEVSRSRLPAIDPPSVWAEAARALSAGPYLDVGRLLPFSARRDGGDAHRVG